MGPFEILCGIAAVILGFYYYSISTFNFWESRGVRGPRPTAIFGNVKDLTLLRKSLSDFMMGIYNDFKEERMIGIFARRTPVLILNDPDFIKDVLIKDFSKFANRGFPTHDKAEPLGQHLFTLDSKRWRPLRVKLSPVFTSGKMKEMFIMISECASQFQRYVEKVASKNEPVEIRELTAKYTTDVIGTCAFGIDINAMSDKDSEFRIMGRKVFTPTWTAILRARIIQHAPWIFDIFGSLIPQTELTKFFTRVITETIDSREKNNIVRHDFVDMLRELKKHPDKVGDIELTDSLITAQAFVFFVAGFETSSTTMSNALYELAINQEIQDKLREEIDEQYAKHGNNIMYENVKKMDYLDKIFKETLRKYPPLPFLMRQSTSDYTFEGTKIDIPKGTRLWIPIHAIQKNPNIYPKPDVFDPERFSEEIAQSRHPMYYLPFGDGPRNCIGARFGVFQTKIGLIKFLRNYKVETCEKTKIPYPEIDTRAFLLIPKDGIYLRITKINRA